NVVDDEMPTQRRYLALLRKRTTPRPFVVPIAWTVMRTLAATVATINRTFLGGKAKVPGFLIPSRLHARCKPLRYSNSRIRQVLGWRPLYSLNDALDRSLGNFTTVPPWAAGAIPAKHKLSAAAADLISMAGH